MRMLIFFLLCNNLSTQRAKENMHACAVLQLFEYALTSVFEEIKQIQLLNVFFFRK